MREAFALAKSFSLFFPTKNFSIFQIIAFEILTNNIVSFKQLGPVCLFAYQAILAHGKGKNYRVASPEKVYMYST